MNLVCYPTSGEPPKIVTAPFERVWMSQTPNRFAYRCLPLNVANAHGWWILNPVPFSAVWDGRADVDGVHISPCYNDGSLLAISHFGNGILTFTVGGLFKTEPGFDLVVTGPINEVKDGIQPLTAIVETDWVPFTFTMNWRFTRRNAPITFERNEPFCMIFPIKRSVLDETVPTFQMMSDNQNLQRDYQKFASSRSKFNEDLKVPGSAARGQKWQKDYFQGIAPSAQAPSDHRTKISLKEFTEK